MKIKIRIKIYDKEMFNTFCINILLCNKYLDFIDYYIGIYQY